MYGLRTMLFGAPKQVRDDRVALAAHRNFGRCSKLISQGEDSATGLEKLVAVSTQVAAVGDETQKQQLMDQFNDLVGQGRRADPRPPPPGITTVPPRRPNWCPRWRR